MPMIKSTKGTHFKYWLKAAVGVQQQIIKNEELCYKRPGMT